MNGMAERRRPDALEIAPEGLASAVATALIADLNRELSARYPEPGAPHFQLDPGEVAPGTGIFLVARWFGRPVGCGALRSLREPALMHELGPRVGELKRMYVSPENERPGYRTGVARPARSRGAHARSRAVGARDWDSTGRGARPIPALGIHRDPGVRRVFGVAYHERLPGESPVDAKRALRVACPARRNSD
jgi:putative acetyltransferase